MRAIHSHASKRGYNRITLEAQCYTIPFYEKLGYTAHGEVFLDANIKHRHMSRQLSASSSAVDCANEFEDSHCSHSGAAQR